MFFCHEIICGFTPLTVTFFMMVISVMVLPFFRKLEGLPMQNLSLASNPGDLFLSLTIGVQVEVLQRTGGTGWSEGIFWNSCVIFFAAVFIVSGLVEVHLNEDLGGISEHKDDLTDLYHRFVVVPLLGYYIVSMVPVIFVAQPGEAVTMLVAVTIWLFLLVDDIREGRLDQAKYWNKARIVQWPRWPERKK